jgi:hypothetical protein
MIESRMRGLLVRVGIDSACGAWNAPVDLTTGNFVYVPIPESRPLRRGTERNYDKLARPLANLGTTLPTACKGKPSHLDPDFEFLTYGDQGSRAERIREVLACGGGFIAFYAGLRDVKSGELVDALIGFYRVAEVVEVEDFPRSRWDQNAHTRRKSFNGDVVVLGEKGRSGRFARCIVIGRYRDRAHRVDRAVLNAWGGLTVRDGYIQRSARLPEFVKPARFLDWLRAQTPRFIAENNPA